MPGLRRSARLQKQNRVKYGGDASVTPAKDQTIAMDPKAAESALKQNPTCPPIASKYTVAGDLNEAKQMMLNDPKLNTVLFWVTITKPGLFKRLIQGVKQGTRLHMLYRFHVSGANASSVNLVLGPSVNGEFSVNETILTDEKGNFPLLDKTNQKQCVENAIDAHLHSIRQRYIIGEPGSDFDSIQLK